MYYIPVAKWTGLLSIVLVERYDITSHSLAYTQPSIYTSLITIVTLDMLITSLHLILHTILLVL